MSALYLTSQPICGIRVAKQFGRESPVLLSPSLTVLWAHSNSPFGGGLPGSSSANCPGLRCFSQGPHLATAL